LPGNEVLAELIPTMINATDAALARFQPTDRNCYTDEERILLCWSQTLILQGVYFGGINFSKSKNIDNNQKGPFSPGPTSSGIGPAGHL
jgi:hypothetical protein